jgi:hypothetical protein
MDLRMRRRVVAGGIVAIGVILLGTIIGLTAIDRGGAGVLEGADPVTAIREAPGKLDGKRLRAEITVGTAGALQLEVKQVGTFDGGANRSDVAVTGLGSGEVRIVTDGPTFYVRGAKPFAGKPWGRLAAADAGPISQVSGSQLTTLLTALRTVRSATDSGVETLGGVRVRHFTSTIAVRDLAAASPAFAQVGAAADAPLEVLLDADGAPRQISITAEAGATKVHLGATITDIGKPGPVEIPPAGDVAEIGLDDLSALLGR